MSAYGPRRVARFGLTFEMDDPDADLREGRRTIVILSRYFFTTLTLSVFNDLGRFVLTSWTFECPLVMVRPVRLDECQPHRLATLRATGPLKPAQRVRRFM
jgi:hypothetical protein